MKRALRPGGWADGGGRARRWAVGGTLVGALVGVAGFAPAAWLGKAIADGSAGRLLLADARGTVWTGSAVVVLTGGPGSRDASALPGRLRWKLRRAPGGLTAVELRLRHDCCLAGEQRVRIEPGFGRLRVAWPAGRSEIGHWPAAWLVGLGPPWNTLRLGGTVQLAGEDLALEAVQGRWRLAGRAQLELLDVSSRIAPVEVLGSYRVDIGAAAAGSEGASLRLDTLEGALQMDGSGQWNGERLRFRGSARAAAGSEPVLNNLLNLLGRRQGGAAILSIG